MKNPAGIRELSIDEINLVAGGPLFVIPKVIVGKKILTWAAGAGVGVGIAGATIALTND